MHSYSNICTNFQGNTLFSWNIKRPVELCKNILWEPGDLWCVTCAGLPCLLLQSQQGWKGPGDELGGMLQDGERMFQPPVTRQASVEQQEPKQAGSKVTQMYCSSGTAQQMETGVTARKDVRDRGEGGLIRLTRWRWISHRTRWTACRPAASSCS